MKQRLQILWVLKIVPKQGELNSQWTSKSQDNTEERLDIAKVETFNDKQTDAVSIIIEQQAMLDDDTKLSNMSLCRILGL